MSNTSSPDFKASRPLSRGASPELIVDLGALVDNYKTFCSLTSGESAGVLKANAYGLGCDPVAQALWEEGCKSYFVALVQEAIELRAMLPKAKIFVLSPYLHLDSDLLKEYNLVPCLYDLEGLDLWIAAHNSPAGNSLAPAALHFETGINRLGLSTEDLEQLLANKQRLGKLDIKLVMSHLSNADEQNSPHNPKQLKIFKAIRAEFPDAPASLANTAGIFLGPDYHFDLLRPGIGLYGHDPHYYENQATRLKTVATFSAPLAQIKQLRAGEAIGYGATEVSEDTDIGVILFGYADGVMRTLYRPETGEAHLLTINGHKAPLIGRVSMDMITIDLTGVPKSARQVGTMVEIFGPNSLIEDAASIAGTSPYELFTRVSSRATRIYV